MAHIGLMSLLRQNRVNKMKLKIPILKIYTKFRTVIFPVLVALASITLIIFVTLPQIQNYFKSQGSLSIQRSKLARLEVKAEQLGSINEGDLNRKVQVALSSLPADKDLTRVIGTLQQQGLATGVALSSIVVASTEDTQSQGASGFLVKVEITTTRDGLNRFLEKVEDAPLIMRVSSLDISSQLGGQIVNAGVVINVFYSPTPTNLGNIDDSPPTLTPEEEDLIANLSKVAVPPLSGLAGSSGTNLPLGKSNPFE